MEKQCERCGATCPYAEMPEHGDCEGQVMEIMEADWGDGDGGWLHACNKHEHLVDV